MFLIFSFDPRNKAAFNNKTSFDLYAFICKDGIKSWVCRTQQTLKRCPVPVSTMKTALGSSNLIMT